MHTPLNAARLRRYLSGLASPVLGSGVVLSWAVLCQAGCFLERADVELHPCWLPRGQIAKCNGADLCQARSVFAEHRHGHAVLDGALWAWGYNTENSLGTDTDSRDAYAPLRVGSQQQRADQSWPTDWVEAHAGTNHGCALARNGSVACWGRGAEGQLGRNSSSRSASPTAVVGGPWRQLAVGNSFTCAIDSVEQVWCWGSNRDRGMGIAGPHQYLPVRVPGLPAACQRIDAGYANHSCALCNGDRSAGYELYCWGSNRGGQLGVGEASLALPVTRVPGRWRDVAVGHRTTCAIAQHTPADNGGSLWCWGKNDAFVLGFPETDLLPCDGSTACVLEPRQVGERSDWVQVSTANDFTCARDSSCRIYCWGNATDGRLGVDGALTGPTMQQIEGDEWSHVSVGFDAACAVEHEDIYCWGNASVGQVGTGAIGSSEAERLPVRLSFGDP